MYLTLLVLLLVLSLLLVGELELIFETASMQSLSVREEIITFAPRADRPFAMWKPIPLEPPVIRKVLFTTEKREGGILAGTGRCKVVYWVA